MLGNYLWIELDMIDEHNDDVGISERVRAERDKRKAGGAGIDVGNV